MTLKSSSVSLKNVRIRAFHGVLPQERLTGADFTVTLTVDYDVTQAALNDNLEGTVSYARLYDIVRQQMAVPSQLLEHVAYRIASAVCQEFPKSTAVDVEITKVNPPMGALGDGAAVTLHFVNQ